MVAGGAAAAARRRRDMEELEEEEAALYSGDDLREDWEFKFVRSATGAFRAPATLRAVVEEEAVAGWQLLEKFDDHRLRFKRPASARQRDEMLPKGADPYRTTYGHSDAFIAFLIVSAIILGALAIAAFAMVAERGAL